MDKLMETAGGVILVFFLIGIVVFLILRHFWCWYWKINERVRLMEEANALLTDIRALLVQGNTVNAVTAGQITDLANSGGAAGSIPTDESDIPDL